ncbi:MAG: 2-hydroxyacid dehydrogenase [Pseudomonadota bacterium]
MSQPTILMLSPLPTDQEAQLDRMGIVHRAYSQEDPSVLYDEIADDVTVITTFVTVPCRGELMGRFKNLRLVANFGVGYDGVETDYCAKNGIIVTNTPDVLTDEVADTALGLLLMTVRELPQAEQYLRAGKWMSNGAYPLTSATLQNRTLGIYGLGRIGLAIAKRAEAFNMPIEYHNRSKREDVSYTYHESLIGLAYAVDTLMVVVPGGSGTQNAINDDILEALGPNGILINIGRGSTVDEDALSRALKNNTILGAGLDVFAKEPHVPEDFFHHPRTVLLPHVASASHYTRGLMAQVTVDNVKAFAEDGTVVTPVPETPFAAVRTD